MARSITRMQARKRSRQYRTSMRNVGVAGGVPRSTSRIPLAAAPPSRMPKGAARYGKYVAAGVVAAGAVNAFGRRSGRGIDRTVGRPTGMYGF